MIVAQHSRRPLASSLGLAPISHSQSPILLPTDHCPLTTSNYWVKPFSCNTYASLRKCCKQKTYGQAKSFTCNTYKKPGVGVFFPSRCTTGAAEGNSSPSLTTLMQALFIYALTECKFPNSFVLIFMQIGGGYGGAAVINRDQRRKCTELGSMAVVGRRG